MAIKGESKIVKAGEEAGRREETGKAAEEGSGRHVV